MSLVPVTGFISGGLGILQFGLDNFVEPVSTGSNIRIAVGLDVPGYLHNAGGELPDVKRKVKIITRCVWLNNPLYTGFYN